ncbi:MAG: nitroreductase family protein [Dehalococcoidia bacterium]
MPDDSSGQIGLFEAIYSTRALRRLKPDPIPDEVLFQLFDAAVRGPSGGNAQDARYVLISDRAVKRQVQTWFTEAWEAYQPRYAADPALMDALPRSQRLALKSTDHLARHVGDAPVIIAVCGLRGKHSTPGGSIFPAVQNLLLAARALGLGGSITNFARGHEAELMQILGIPEEYQVYCLIPLGYSTDRHGPLRRRSVKRIVFYDRWQEPWQYAQEQPDEGWGDRWLNQG